MSTQPDYDDLKRTYAEAIASERRDNQSLNEAIREAEKPAGDVELARVILGNEGDRPETARENVAQLVAGSGAMFDAADADLRKVFELEAGSCILQGHLYENAALVLRLRAALGT